nr:MAG TPA: Sporulation initiation factor Spo0A C terminal [Caudoviricetes sp.]
MNNRKIKEVLWDLGVGNKYKGFQYCIYSLELAIESPDRLNSITKGIYPDVAKKYKTGVNCVEWDIRTVAEVVWKNGGKELFINDLTGDVFEKRPTNAKFLEILLHYILSDAPCQKCKVAEDYKERLIKLEEENRRLEATIMWMHDLIWKFIKEYSNNK